jgi:hypothetical protein
VPTAGIPFDGYLVLNEPGYLTSRFYVSKSLTNHTQVGGIFLTTQTFLSLVYNFRNLPLQTSAATVIASVRDCNLAAVEGAAVTFSQGGSPSGALYYADTTGLPSSSLAATSAAGVAWGLNIPSGITTEGASWHALTLSQADFNTAGGQITFVAVIP